MISLYNFKRMAAVIFFLLSLPVVVAETGITWTVQDLQSSTALWNVHFLDSLHGWACGDNGTVVRTYDGGTTWTNRRSGTSGSMRAVFFADQTTGWAANDAGYIFKSTDRGSTWAIQHTEADAWFNDAWFFSDSVGLVVGGTSNGYDGLICRTTNGGAGWTTQTHDDFSQIMCLSFINGDQGWASGANDIASTSDGGASWGGAVTGGSGYINEVFFLDGTTGFGVGRYGDIMKSSGGGWSMITEAYKYNWMEGIAFPSYKYGLIAGERGFVATSFDSGATWQSSFPHHPSSLDAAWFRAVCPVSPNLVWMVGDDGIIMQGRFYEYTGVWPLVKDMPRDEAGSPQTMALYDIKGFPVAVGHELPPGIYFLKSRTGNKVNLCKIIVPE